MKCIIPSKDRHNQLYDKTISFLRRMAMSDDSIYVFIPASQYKLYKRPNYNINIITLPDEYDFKTTLNFIHQKFLEEGEKCIRLDDDIEEMYYCPDKSTLMPFTYQIFYELYFDTLVKLENLGLKLAGINPTGNAFFCSPFWGKTQGSYLVGAFQIFINDRKCQLRSYSTCEDVEQICRHIKYNTYCLKINAVTLKTKWFGKGGLEEVRKNDYELMEIEHSLLQNEYPHLFNYDLDKVNGKIKCKFRWIRPRMIDKENFTIDTRD